jgi:ferrous iron transport protein A
MTMQVFDLLSCKAGVPYRITGLHGGPGFQARLRNLGFVPGQTIVKLHTHPFSGPVTVQIGHTQLALGRGMAARILVESIP